MRLLLDTNALLWWLFGLPRLGRQARAAIADEANEVYVSAVSACEISIKQAVGKLEAPAELERRLAEEAFTPLPVTIRHGVGVAELPLHHRDPFDRILLAQARCESLTLITADRRLAAYDVPILPAGRAWT